MNWTATKGNAAEPPHGIDSPTATNDPVDAEIPASPFDMAILRDYFLSSVKPRNEWRVGAELELLGYDAKTQQRLDHTQIQSAIKDLAVDAEDHTFDGGVFAGAHQTSGGDLTVEPGGQLEYSSAPRSGLAAIELELKDYLARLKVVAETRGMQFLALGFDPLRRLDEQHWFPKPRYEIMRPYMAGQGARAWDMMTRTCAVQVSLDFDSETDLIRKFVLGNRLAPFVAAMFANSPFAEGRPSGFKSTRGLTWLETDPDRSGLPELAWSNSASVDELVRYALDVPMLFRRRDGRYRDGRTGVKFRNYLSTVELTEDELLADWADHLTTIFTEARVKQYVELRSADCGSLPLVMAAQALWKGLLYDLDSQIEAAKLLPDLNSSEMAELQWAVAREGLQAQANKVSVLGPAQELVRLATAGLQRQAPDEVRFLDILHQQVIDEAICPADILLRNWEGSWHHSMEPVFAATRIA
ncbi:MAG: glutamate-cysteine ligase family protein [Pyrinomonadaceae bacterium]